MTSKPEHFELMGSYAIFRPIGEVTLNQGVALVTAAIVYAREHKVKLLLANISGLTGFASPSMVERYFFVQEWARAAMGAVRMSMVIRPEMVDPTRFGITVAENHGLKTNVFTDENEALAWLQKN